jgi:hypothetical protein
MQTTAPADVDISALDARWSPYKCATGRRFFDRNPALGKIRYYCERCKKNHIVDPFNDESCAPVR